MIPLIDLQAQYRQIGPEIEAAVVRVLRSGRYALGPEVSAFEEELARYCGVAHAVGTSSGTSALTLALQSCGIGPGDEVVTVPFTFVATVAAILDTGATPRLVDIDPVTMTLDPASLDRAFTERTRAVVPVHLYGHPAEMDPIVAAARRRGVVVVEDAAQAHGARYRDRPVGSLGDLGCFSFYPSKNLGACGEGGAVVTNDAERADRLRQLRNWGQTDRYRHVARGGNHRLDEIQAAVLRVKLRHLDAWNDARRAVAARYDRLLAGVPVVTPLTRADATHAYHVYVLRTPRRDTVVGALRARGIGVAVHYPEPVHLQPAYRELGDGPGAHPRSETAAGEVLSIPMFPELTADDAGTVVDTIVDALTRNDQ